MKELLLFSAFTCCVAELHFLRSGLIVDSGVNISGLLVCSGNLELLIHKAAVLSVSMACKHNSTTSLLSGPPLISGPLTSAVRYPLLLLSSASSLCLCIHKHQSLPVLVLSSISTPLHPLILSSIFLCVRALLITPHSYHINRRKQGRKAVGSAGWMTLMRSL